MRAVLAALAILVAGCSNSPPETQSIDGGEDFDYGVEATATTGVIRGYVVDATITPILGVNVSIAALATSTLTNEDGAFGFEGLEPGTYFVDASKFGYSSIQTSIEVVAGDSEPPLTKISLNVLLEQRPYFEVYSYQAYITCGFAIVATSVGCNTFPDVGEAIGDRVYFPFTFTLLPSWIQGELVWDHTQPAGGMAIWQLAGCDDTSTDPTGNNYCDGPPSQASPALTYAATDLIQQNNKSMLESGVQFSIFGGPAEACNAVFYGCGVTLQQKYTVYAHVLYNYAPAEGWRFTSHGDPLVPP